MTSLTKKFCMTIMFAGLLTNCAPNQNKQGAETQTFADGGWNAKLFGDAQCIISGYEVNIQTSNQDDITYLILKQGQMPEMGNGRIRSQDRIRMGFRGTYWISNSLIQLAKEGKPTHVGKGFTYEFDGNFVRFDNGSVSFSGKCPLKK